MDEEAELGRVLTAPNLITLARLLCIPIFLWLLFGLHHQTYAAVLLAVLGATDWVDGFVARRYHQVSTLGKVLDPAADRVLVGTAVIAVIVHGAVPVWFGVATLAREALVSVMVVLLATLGAARINVLWIGKAGTFAPDVRLSGLLARRWDGVVAGAHPRRGLDLRPDRPGARLVRRRRLRGPGPGRLADGPLGAQECRMTACRSAS